MGRSVGRLLPISSKAGVKPLRDLRWKRPPSRDLNASCYTCTVIRYSSEPVAKVSAPEGLLAGKLLAECYQKFRPERPPVPAVQIIRDDPKEEAPAKVFPGAIIRPTAFDLVRSATFAAALVAASLANDQENRCRVPTRTIDHVEILLGKKRGACECHIPSLDFSKPCNSQLIPLIF